MNLARLDPGWLDDIADMAAEEIDTIKREKNSQRENAMSHFGPQACNDPSGPDMQYQVNTCR